MTRARPRRLAALVALGVAAWVRAASGQAAAAPAPSDKPAAELPRRAITVAPDKAQVLRATFGFRDLADKGVVERLTSGVPVVIALRAYVFREDDREPVALSVRSCRVVYDLWDEVFRIRVTGPGIDRDVAALNTEGVLRQCAEVKDFPLVDRRALARGRAHFVGVIAEVNPMSPEMLEQMRRWVSRPAGSTGLAPGDALFGSFVGLFVRQVGAADRTLRFRSQAILP